MSTNHQDPRTPEARREEESLKKQFTTHSPTAIATASRSHSSDGVDHDNHHRVLFRRRTRPLLRRRRARLLLRRRRARLLFRRCRYSPPMEQSQSNPHPQDNAEK
nr:uncharacterized protein LOC112721878 [Arachis hypogaea]